MARALVITDKGRGRLIHDLPVRERGAERP